MKEFKDFRETAPTLDDIERDPKDGKLKIKGPMKFSTKTFKEAKELHKVALAKFGAGELPFDGDNFRPSKNADTLAKMTNKNVKTLEAPKPKKVKKVKAPKTAEEVIEKEVLDDVGEKARKILASMAARKKKIEEK